MKSLLLVALTGPDNHTTDVARLLWVMFSCVFCGLYIAAICLFHYAFNPMECAGAMGTIMTTGAACVRIKSNSEPNQITGGTGQ